jgi:hypothetical protein
MNERTKVFCISVILRHKTKTPPRLRAARDRSLTCRLGLEAEINSGTCKGRPHIHRVGENVGGECNWGRKGRQVAGWNGCHAEIIPEQFPFKRQVVTKVIFRAASGNPPWPRLIDSCALMGGGKRIRKQSGIFHVGDGSACSSVEQKASKNQADPRTNGECQLVFAVWVTVNAVGAQQGYTPVTVVDPLRFMEP